EPLLEEVDAQHLLEPQRLPAAPAFGQWDAISASSFRPRDDRVPLGQKPLPPRHLPFWLHQPSALPKRRQIARTESWLSRSPGGEFGGLTPPDAPAIPARLRLRRCSWAWSVRAGGAAREQPPRGGPRGTPSPPAPPAPTTD